MDAQLAIVPYVAVSSSSSSSSSSSKSATPKPRPRQRPRTEEKPKRLHHCIFSAPRDESENMQKPEQLGREGFAALLKQVADEVFGDRNRLLKFSVWQEQHADVRVHLHAPLLCDRPCVSGPLLRKLKENRVYAYFEQSSSEYYWSLILYLSVPSASKTHCDSNPWLCEHHGSVLDVLKDIPRGASRVDKDRARAFLGDKGLIAEARTMDHTEFGHYVVKHSLRTKTSLLAFLRKENSDRKADEARKAAERYAFRYSKELEQRLSFAWAFADAEQKQKLDSLTAWQMVELAGNGECRCGQHDFASLLTNNLEFQCTDFPEFLPSDEKPLPVSVREAFKAALKLGARKFGNPFLFGPRNSGKSTALAALESIFGAQYCFSRPVGRGNFLMQGLLGKKVAVLQDLRTNSLRISWDSLLAWLEGTPIVISLPRTSAAEDILYSDRAPVFISSAEKFRISVEACVKENISDPSAQNLMMDSRFRFFHFWKSRPTAQIVECSPCGRCFSTWLQVGDHPQPSLAAAPSASSSQIPSQELHPSSEHVAASGHSSLDGPEPFDRPEFEEEPDPFQFAHESDDDDRNPFADYPYYEDCLPHEDETFDM